MKLFCNAFLVLFIVHWSVPAFSQISSDSINMRIEEIYAKDTSENQLTRDLQMLGQQYPADSLLILVKINLTRHNTYSNPDSALVYGMQALELAKKMKSKEDMAETYRAVGEVLRVLGNYPKAVEFTLKALPLAEELKDTLFLSLAYNQLGIAYNGDGDYQNAIHAIYKSLSYVSSPIKNYSDSALTELTDIYLAEVYSAKNSLDSALYFGIKAEIMDRLIGRNWPWVSLQLGRIYSKMKNEQQALVYYNKAYKARWLKDSIDSYNGIAELFLSVGKVDSAIHYGNKALSKDVSHTYLPEMFATSTLLSDAYEKAGKKDSALKYLKLSSSLKDSIFNLAKVREVQSLSLEEQLRQQDIAERDRKAEETRVRNLQLLAIGIFIPMFFLVALLLSRTRVKPRVVEFLGILSLLLFFEFITDLIYPYVRQTTNDNPIWEILFLVILASLLEPLNFRLEHWVKKHLVHKHVPVPIPVLVEERLNEAGSEQNI